MLAFCLIHDADLGRIPDLLFFLDGRGDFHFRRIPARGNSQSSSENRDSGQMSIFLSSAAELTGRKQRITLANKSLNGLVESLGVCGHLRAGGNGGDVEKRILRVEYDVLRGDDGYALKVDLSLTIWNDSSSFVFQDGWNWNLGKPEVGLSRAGLRLRSSWGSSDQLFSVPLVISNLESGAEEVISVQRSASLLNLRPGQFRKICVPLQVFCCVINYQ